MSKSTDKEGMLTLLNQYFQLDFNALYQLPSYVSEFDDELASVSSSYIQNKKEEHRLAMSRYKRSVVVWEKALEKKKTEMLSVCTNDACRSGGINDVRRLFSVSKPVEPQESYIAKERVYVSLQTLFAWQKDALLLQFVKKNGAELIPNKLFLTDAMLIYFIVDKSGKNTVVKP